VRNLLLVLALITVAAGLVLLLSDRDPNSKPAALHGDSGAPEDGTPKVTAPSQAAALARESVDPQAVATLTVRVVDPKGGPVHGALITIEVDGEVQDARDNGRFDGLTPGPCSLRVEHPDYPTWERVLALTAGQDKRRIVQLRRDLELRGTVHDRFGLPRPGTRVWFLRPSERHPLDPVDARPLISAMADRDGRLRVTLPEAGTWHASVGPVGEAVLQDEPRELTLGAVDSIEIVLGEQTLLEVRCAKSDSSSTATVQILVRAEQRADLAMDGMGLGPGTGSAGGPSPVNLGLPNAPGNKPEDRDLRAKRLAAAAVARGDDAPPPPFDGSEGEPSEASPEWVSRATRRVPNDGVVIFKDLPAAQEFRVGIVRGGQRYESLTGVILAPDERVLVDLDLPPDLDTVHPVTLPLPLRWKTERLAPDENPAGVRWN
jgi:Carboxypeptidase regulatory-like domain